MFKKSRDAIVSRERNSSICNWYEKKETQAMSRSRCDYLPHALWIREVELPVRLESALPFST